MFFCLEFFLTIARDGGSVTIKYFKPNISGIQFEIPSSFF